MRLLRLRLRDFRGVEEREVAFLRDGVTVLVGPNEVGKSSMAEALDLLFTVQDSSTKAEVRAVKPVDRDAGPEVEADIETGPYAFTYRKRYLKGAETVLRITRPVSEQLTGRQAHERVEQILAETMDAALWRALTIKQGEGLGQASLAEAASLGQALDRAAGTVPEGQAETSLFDRAWAEYEQYWTPTGRAKGDWPLREAVREQQSTLDGIEAQLRSLAADVERAADLAVEHDHLVEAKGPEESRARELEARWRQIEEQVRDVERLDEAEKAARMAAERGAEASRGRTAAVEELARAAADRDRHRAAAEAAAPSLASARERAARAAAVLSDARRSRDAAEARARAARSDVDFLRARDQLAELTERREALLAAQASLADAEATARANPVDEAALDEIRSADAAARVARGLLEQARPTVAVTALRSIAVLVDGAPLSLAPGEAARRPVEDRLGVELPDTLRVEVSAGRADASLAAEAADAERTLRAACERVGVADLAAAEGAAAARRDARAAWTEQKRRIADLLAGDDSERLDARIAMAERRTRGYLDARPAGSPMPADEDAAAAAAEDAEAAAESARTAESAAEREDRAAREQLTTREVEANEAAVRADLAEHDLEARAVALEAARAAVADTALDEALARAVADHGAAVAATASARAALEGQGPDAAKALLDNARLVVDEMGGRLRDLEIAQAEVRARLRDHGEDGLAERRDDALTARDAAAAELDRWMRRANARKALYEALKRARDAAHLAYVGPLRDKLTSLGRVVFGPSLGIEVGEDLRVRNRTLDGRTVPFDSLSVGAKEQLGVLMRLAGAMLVAQDGGVPVLLDDTLGFSDPRRLEAMGAVLGIAGASCQVIVLTCYPERYRHVGGARTVALS